MTQGDANLKNMFVAHSEGADEADINDIIAKLGVAGIRTPKHFLGFFDTKIDGNESVHQFWRRHQADWQGKGAYLSYLRAVLKALTQAEEKADSETKEDLDLIKARLKAAVQDFEAWQAKQGVKR